MSPLWLLLAGLLLQASEASSGSDWRCSCRSLPTRGLASAPGPPDAI